MLTLVIYINNFGPHGDNYLASTEQAVFQLWKMSKVRFQQKSPSTPHEHSTATAVVHLSLQKMETAFLILITLCGDA